MVRLENLSIDGKRTSLTLHLDMIHILTLRQKYGESTKSTLMAALVDFERLNDVLEAALSHHGNQNITHDAEKVRAALAARNMTKPIAMCGLLTLLGGDAGIYTDSDVDAVQMGVENETDNVRRIIKMC